MQGRRCFLGIGQFLMKYYRGRKKISGDWDLHRKSTTILEKEAFEQ